MTDIPAEDLQIEVWPPSTVGGQHVGVPNGIKVTHLPSLISVTVNSERSQHRNKAIAIDAILGAITSPHYRG